MNVINYFEVYQPDQRQIPAFIDLSIDVLLCDATIKFLMDGN